VANYSQVRFFDSVGPAAHALQANDHVVFVDDFVGTGKTAAARIKYVKKIAHKQNVPIASISVISVAAMEASKPVILATSARFESLHTLRRGIRDEYNPQHLPSMVNAMKRLEERIDLSGNRRQYRFGYKKSEALYGIELGNTPNNVFPLFWLSHYRDANPRNTILHRN
jgi:hypothetical protein